MNFKLGCNLAWLNYGGDFGGGAKDGNLTNRATLDYWFAQMQSAGMNTCRWFMATLPNPPQFVVDGNGLPTGIADSVWPDLDLALDLAWQRGISLQLCLFDRATDVPAAWRDTSGGRAALVKALGQMLARYATHPNIGAWELGNEWDKFMYPGAVPSINVPNAKMLVSAFATHVHATTNRQVTMSCGGANMLDTWRNLGLDFYQAHWYDRTPPLRTDMYNLASHKAADYKLDRPLLVGEAYLDVLTGTSGMSAIEKYRWFQAAGYAGVLGWSATPAAADGMRIDWAAAGRFAAELHL